jgi:hypothetical protein
METKEMQAMKELDKEIEELENLINAPQEEPIDEKVEQPTVSKEEPTPQVIAETSPDLQKDLENANKRFNNYKGSTDKKLFELRTKVKELESLISSLRSENAKLKKSLEVTEDKSITSYLSQEDQEILGESAVQALDRSIKEMVNQQVNPLKSQLDTEAERRKDLELQRAQDLEIQKQQRLISQLTSIVPDFQRIVEMDDFRLRYMKEPDEYSGIIRERLFNAAEEDGDVGRVASFFKDYLHSIKAKEDVLEQSITPTGIQGSADVRSNTEEIQITSRFIDEFYNDVTKGHPKYKGKEGRALAQKIEAQIDRAVMEGTVI